MTEIITEPAVLADRIGPATRTPWIMAMQWHDLAFIHWPIEPEQLQPFIPAGLELQTFDGSAWLGIVPFYMRGVRLRGLPPLPGTGAFAELNLRTYVIADGRPGVWFFSLDAASRLAVRIARRTFHLPYQDARMNVSLQDNVVRYESRRVGRPAIDFLARYWPTGKAIRSVPGSIEYWLTERYCLYSADRRGRIYRGEVHHLPWPLQEADCQIEVNLLATPLGIELSDRPKLVHFSKRLDVVAWYLSRI